MSIKNNALFASEKESVIGSACSLFLTGFYVFVKDPFTILFSAAGTIISTLFVFFSTFIFLRAAGMTTRNTIQMTQDVNLQFLIIFFVSFVMFFFRSAIINTVAARVRGEKTSFPESLGLARKNFDALFGWSFVSSVIVTLSFVFLKYCGSVLSATAIIVFLILWALSTFYILPPIATEHVGLISALKRSVYTMGKTWRETIIVGILFEIIFFMVLFFVLIALVVLTFGIYGLIGVPGVLPLFILPFVIFALMLVFLASIFVITMRTIFRFVLYHYAYHGRKFTVGIYPRESVAPVIKK